MYGLNDEIQGLYDDLKKEKKKTKHLMEIVDTLLNNRLSPAEQQTIRRVFEMLKAADGESENPS